MLIPALWLSTLAIPAGAVEPTAPERLDEVAKRGAQVMPFDLEKTSHIFTATPTGGVQRVVAKDANDSEQIRHIRAHLSEIAARFAQGDFSGPQAIHGADMPGLAVLKSRAAEIRFRYRELPDGAQIHYSADDPALVGAIHHYFSAQLHDHGRHAMEGHGRHHAE
ncbi:aspartate carbamoyltransferase [Methylococcus sp. EFPC2]|nr:aspartate carbamoyltransferase [Methylococcus sp. EFPC2]